MADVKIFAEQVEDKAREQVEKIAAHPAFRDAKIRIMPDVHAGKGCVCGFTGSLGDKVVPNLVGVDIGCGVTVIELGRIDVDFARLDKVIRDAVPSGMGVHGSQVAAYDHLWTGADPRKCVIGWTDEELDYFDRSVGSLGGGNHFLEVDEDENGDKYLLVHTGSRNFGKKVCERWQEKAAERMRRPEFAEEDIEAILGEMGA